MGFRCSSVEATGVVAPLHLVAEHFPPMGCPQQPAQQEIARENNFENKDKTKKGEKENDEVVLPGQEVTSREGGDAVLEPSHLRVVLLLDPHQLALHACQDGGVALRLHSVRHLELHKRKLPKFKLNKE